MSLVIGTRCGWCEETIKPTDRGVILEGAIPVHHMECFIRMIVGSVGHQMRVCSCFGGHAGDMEGHSKREAAIAAYTLFTNRQTPNTQI